MNETFKEIDPTTYADWSKAQWAQKTVNVLAEKVGPETTVETIMKNGHVETTKTAGSDGGYKVTNPDGEQYLVDPAKFESRYDASTYSMISKPDAPKPAPAFTM